MGGSQKSGSAVMPSMDGLKKRSRYAGGPVVEIEGTRRYGFNSTYRLTLHNAGHDDPRTTLTYIRSRDRLSKSPAYVLRY